MTTAMYLVTGMTCEHCARAVTSELAALEGVSGITVDLIPGGQSQVTVTSGQPVPEPAIVTALDEAGGYVLAVSPGRPR